jgi:hypothetical protein
MATFMIKRHGSNGANQPMTQESTVAFVEADSEDEARERARKCGVTVYNNQQLEAISFEDADADEWNAAAEEGVPTYERRAKINPLSR